MDSDDELLMSIPLDMCSQHVSRPAKIPVLSSQKQNSWVSSAFDDFGQVPSSKSTFSQKKLSTSSFTGHKKRSRKEDEDVTVVGTSQSHDSNQGSDLWAEKHSPTTLTDLAVHKKKISEVQDWLNHAFTRTRGKAPLLLLTGPSGVGKTATLQVLAREMRYQLQEWINPVASVYNALEDQQDGFRGWQGSFGSKFGQSQSSQFQDFLLRANKYQTLQIFGAEQVNQKVILVEDFPNAFYRDTAQFHGILRNYRQRGHCPLVFVISDSVAGESVERKLFPKDVQEEMQIANISFNPVAQTSLVKVLSRIASTEASKSSGFRMRAPDKSTLEALATASTGDLRGAINALQFACLKDTQDLTTCLTRASSASAPPKKTSRSSKSKRTTSTKAGREPKVSPDERASDLSAIGGRDTSLFLFRALGKILYCKRGAIADFPDHPSLPPHQQHLHRDPMLVNPEDVIEKCHLTSEFFTAYLHQNYLDFYSDVEDVVSASHYLSDADYLTVNWATRSTLREYASSVAARSMMFCNSSRAGHSVKGAGSGLGWKPLHKPQWFSVVKQARSNCQAVKDLFKGQCWTPIELQTNLIPYAALIKPTSMRAGQHHYLQSVGHMDKWTRRVQQAQLDEKDGGEEEEDATISTPLGASHQTQADEDTEVQDEDIEIEDFDD